MNKTKGGFLEIVTISYLDFRPICSHPEESVSVVCQTVNGGVQITPHWMFGNQIRRNLHGFALVTCFLVSFCPHEVANQCLHLRSWYQRQKWWKQLFFTITSVVHTGTCTVFFWFTAISSKFNELFRETNQRQSVKPSHESWKLNGNKIKDGLWQPWIDQGALFHVFYPLLKLWLCNLTIIREDVKTPAQFFFQVKTAIKWQSVKQNFQIWTRNWNHYIKAKSINRFISFTFMRIVWLVEE